MPSHEQVKARFGLELCDGAADMRLADAERHGRPRHSAVTDDGTKQVDMGRVIMPCLHGNGVMGHLTVLRRMSSNPGQKSQMSDG
jgi:hypothetical protein